MMSFLESFHQGLKMNANQYLEYILEKYNPQDLSLFDYDLEELEERLELWASSCFEKISISGSRAKFTANNIGSDIDLMVSLSPKCNEDNGGLKAIYFSLLQFLTNKYGKYNTRKQNVSIRVRINGLDIDITPARRRDYRSNDHSLFLSKHNTWRMTNINKHISDISGSGRSNEIRIIKIWSVLNGLDFPPIYLEYLLIGSILKNKKKGPNYLAENVFYALEELAKEEKNPLFKRVVDPANTNNILSDLIDLSQKLKISSKAKNAISQKEWESIIN